MHPSCCNTSIALMKKHGLRKHLRKRCQKTNTVSLSKCNQQGPRCYLKMTAFMYFY